MTLLPFFPDDVADADALYDSFSAWAQRDGLVLYPHQDEALIEVLSGSNVVVTTPTGSGKSLIATAAHFAARAAGRRTYYTAPIKALVSEKFFALVDTFGAANVGMVTGDASVNGDAPIVCCTAEILANIALREGADADVGQVVMDEFHFIADPDRGWAWHVPLVELPQAQFVIMSATLGDVTKLAGRLEATTGRRIELIAGKPSRHILDAAIARLGVSAARCLMVGDRLATDIAMGHEAGIDTALVLTGVTAREALAVSRVQPTHVLASVADVP